MLLSIATALVIGIIISLTILGLEGKLAPFTYSEGYIKKASIEELWFEGSNPNVLLVNLTYTGGPSGLLSGAKVEDDLGNVVAEGDIVPNVLSDFHETLTINLNVSLNSGEYTLIIHSESGGRCPKSFAVP